MKLKKKIFYFIALMLCLGSVSYSFGSEQRPKVLHLSLHKGCIHEFSAIAQELGFDLESWFICDLPPKFFDGVSQGNALYNIGHARAENIWNLHRDYFESFDAIITSDTVPLSRIFLQNDWKKPLIIWMCNRFDYYDGESLDCDFPDPEYYQLLNEAHFKSHVKIVAYTAFEHCYAKKRGVDTGSLTITPCGAYEVPPLTNSSIPSSIVKEQTFYLPPYSNESVFMDLPALCRDLEIPHYHGRYNGPRDLSGFKGIIHLPYQWSTLAFFENVALGIPYFIPSPAFLEKLIRSGNYFHPGSDSLIDEKLFHLSEWYSPEHADFMIYFHSWEDLKEKTLTTDLASVREKMKNYGAAYKTRMIEKWKRVFETLLIE